MRGSPYSDPGTAVHFSKPVTYVLWLNKKVFIRMPLSSRAMDCAAMQADLDLQISCMV